MHKKKYPEEAATAIVGDGSDAKAIKVVPAVPKVKIKRVGVHGLRIKVNHAGVEFKRDGGGRRCALARHLRRDIRWNQKMNIVIGSDTGTAKISQLKQAKESK